MNGARARRVALFVLTWAVVAVPVGLLTFTHSHITTTVAGHDAVVSPTFDGYATLDLGPYVPNLRYPSGQRLGSAIDLGPTRVTSYEGLIRRYAAIGTQPEGEIGKIAASLGDMAIRSALVGALAGLLCPGVWVLLGSRRRAELSRQVTARRTAAAGLSGVLVVLGLVQPWDAKDPALQEPSSWQPIARALPGVPVPARARPLEVESGLFTRGTRRLAESMLDSYRRGSPSTPSWRGRCRTSPTRSTPLARPRRLLSWSATATTTSAWTRCFGRSAPRAGRRSCSTQADTSTGSSWEAFSLDSLDRVFADYDHRYEVVGNHDEGDFVGRYLDDLSFTRLDGDAADGPDGIRFFGADDPRSSGLGSWRDETGLSFDEHARRVADQVCEYDEQGDRIATLLVHDAETGRYALQRGCVDLVVGGHIHEQLGPTEVVGENGSVGYTYTTGSAGGAAYALAIGSKLRRNAGVTLITYRDGRPVGLQPVTIRTVGDFRVGSYVELDPPPGAPPAHRRQSGPRQDGRAASAWRRWRDLNPREGFALNPLSRRAP